jgi:hypothetical protein
MGAPDILSGGVDPTTTTKVQSYGAALFLFRKFFIFPLDSFSICDTVRRGAISTNLTNPTMKLFILLSVASFYLGRLAMKMAIIRYPNFWLWMEADRDMQYAGYYVLFFGCIAALAGFVLADYHTKTMKLKPSDIQYVRNRYGFPM